MIVVVLVELGVLVKFKIAVLQPVTTVRFVWAVVYVCPFAGQVYEAPAQIDVVTLPVVVNGVTVTIADPLLPVPVTLPDETDTIVNVEVVVGFTEILTGLVPVAE